VTSVAIVPAAGKGERFGSPLKLLADVRGEPMLGRTVRALLEGGVDRVVVVAAPGVSFAAVAALHDPRVTLVVNPDPSRGMFSSIQAGVAAAEGEPIVVLPGDMPFVRGGTVAAVLTAARLGAVISPRYRGQRGHPIVLPARLRSEIVKADPASTLSAVLEAAEEDRFELDVDDPGILRDVDTMKDL
jgi:molybdenum cofactor cytidylyltransferase